MNPLEFIKQLEKENSIKAEEVILEKIKDFSFDRSITFTIRNDELVGLCLRGLEISSLNNLLFFNDSLEVLNLNNNNLIEINELESFNKLVWIYLGHNEIVSIKPINKLRSLTNLYLGSNQITDILPLKRLVSLTELDLSSNTVSDIQPLDKLINLTRLDLSSNKISDLLPLDLLQNLAELDLNSNQISNINSLDKLINLTRLNLSSNRISEINSLEKLKSLTRLNVSSNQISNIQPLEKLSSLTWLILSFNQFTDVQPLANLASLTELEISDNQIVDVQPLAKLTSLIKLNVSSNQISDIQPLEKLSSLITLYLNFNQIINVQSLEKLTSLTTLYVRSNQITDVQPLANLTSLTTLDVKSNQISDIQPLEELSSLTSLDLDSNQITDVQPLVKLSSLTVLYLNSNQITNVQLLENLSSLTTLFLGSNQITDVQPLEKLSSLTTLYLNFNQITDVQPLEKLSSLTSLYLGSNQITDVQPLAKLTSLTWQLYLSFNQITDVQPLSKLTSLTELDISSNQITDVQPLAKLSSLTRLDVSFNQITNVQPLVKLNSLTELSISSNQISNITPVAKLTNLGKLDVRSNQIQSKNITKTFIGYLQNKKSKLYIDIANNPFIDELVGIKKEDYKHSNNHINILLKDYELFIVNDEVLINTVLPQKLVLLGNSNSGKSSLLNYLVKNKLVNKTIIPSTELLNIVNWKENVINYNIYDFGGQDYYHGIYKMFFSKNSYYIILWSQDNNYNHIQLTTTEERKTQYYAFDVNYWLYNIKYHTNLVSKQKEENQWYKNIIFVENKIEKEFKPSYPLQVDKQFLDIEEFKISLKNDKNTFNKTRRAWLKNYLKHLPQNSKKDTVTRNNAVLFFSNFLQKEIDKKHSKLTWNIDELFNTLMKEDKDGWFKLDSNSTEQSEKERILNRFNNSGAILWYANHKSLKNIVWLQPIKVQQHIVEILAKDNIVKDKNNNLRNGKISKKVFERIVTNTTLRDLMLEKKIIFLDGLKNEPTYIIPQQLALMSKEDSLILFALNGIDKGFDLKFKHFLPLGLMHQLIVKFGQNPEKKYYYRYDMLFTFKGEKVYLSVDVKDLIISVRFNSNNTVIWKEIFTEILLTYNNLDDEINTRLAAKKIEYYEKEMDRRAADKGTGTENFKIIQHRSAIIKEIKIDYPEDLLISIHTKEKYFIAYSKLQEAQEEKFTTITASNLKDKEEHKEIDLYKYNAFIAKEIQPPKKIFISYAHKDYKYLERIETHLSALRREHKIEDWNDTKFELGDHWNEKIKSKLKQSDIVILLISADFINSDFIHNVELPIIKKMEENGTCKVFPILVEECDWEYLDFIADIQIYPYYLDRKIENTVLDLPKPIQEWEYKPQAYVQIIKKIREFVNKK